MIVNKSIYLIGIPGCGKSTLGRQFAQHSGYTFIDTDEAIVAEQQKTIEQIYAEGGEPAFRKLEHDLIKTYSNTRKAIICTGGGLPCFHDNMDIMNQNGITVYLDVSPEEIWNRIKDTDLSGRPIYQDKSPQEIQAVITKAITERRSHYSKARITLKNDNVKLQDLVKAIEDLKF